MLSRSPSQISLDSSPKSLDEAAVHLISTPSYPDDQSQKMVQAEGECPEEVAADLPAEKDVMEQEAVAEKPIVEPEAVADKPVVEPEALADKPVVEPEALANIPSYAELDADDIPATPPDKELSLES